MAVYDRDFTTPATTYDDVLKLKEHHIYAGNNVGMALYNEAIAKNTYTYSSTNAHLFAGTAPSATTYSLSTSNEQRILGTRNYHLTNHLGNVLVVVSDKKIPVFENVTTCSSTVTYNNTFTHYTADVQSTTDYSPFNAPLNDRTFNGNIFRYGANGQEKENEIYGDGNTMSAEYWMYDARLGRRWNQDPISFADESPYSTFLNNPIVFSDVLGLTAEGGTETKSNGSGNDNHGDLALINDLEANGKHPDNGTKKTSSINTTTQNKHNAVQQTVVYIKQNVEFQTKNLKEEAPKPTPQKETLGEYYRNMAGNKWSHGDYVEWFGYKLKSAGMDDAKDAELAKEAKPIAEFAADLNPLMAAGHIINGIATDKDAYGNEMDGWDYAIHGAAFIPWGSVIGKVTPALKGLINTVDRSPSVLGHIFRGAMGHVNPKTVQSANRFLSLFEHVANKSGILRTDAVAAGLITQEAANAGVQVFTQTFKRGQVWVMVKDGRIFDAGVNLIPK